MLEEKLKSEGKCLFCERRFAKAGINRHLKNHLEQKAKEEAKPGQSFLVKIENNPRWGTAGYFLSLWVDGNATMKEIDSFLRGIWLECCGHLSAFRNPSHRRLGGMWDYFDAIDLLEQGKTKQYEKLMEESAGEIPMSRKVNKVFHKDLKLEYEYDFGSTTELLLTVIGEYPIKADKKIVLLSRNEPLKILCNECGKLPAAEMCMAHGWNENSLFCPKCAKKHAKKCSDFEEYAAMPITNSPRMGVCAYDGGTIDVERDGIYKSEQ